MQDSVVPGTLRIFQAMKFLVKKPLTNQRASSSFNTASFCALSNPVASTSGIQECMQKLDDGWPESEKDVFQAALSMVVVKDSR